MVSEMSAHRGQVEPCNSTGDVAKVRKMIFFSDFHRKRKNGRVQVLSKKIVIYLKSRLF